MATMTAANRAYNLTTIGRLGPWVLYSNDAYRHVVLAADYDEMVPVPEDDDEGEAFQAWCDDARHADDDTAALVALVLDTDHVHSATSGGCGRLSAREILARRSHDGGTDASYTATWRDASGQTWALPTYGLDMCGARILWTRTDEAGVDDITVIQAPTVPCEDSVREYARDLASDLDG